MEHLPKAFLKQYTYMLKMWSFIHLHVFERPENARKNSIKAQLWFIIFLCALILTAYPIFEHGSLVQVMRNGPMLLIVGQEVFKNYFCIRKKTKVREIIEDLAELWPSEEIVKDAKLDKFVNKLVFFQKSYGFLGIGMSIIFTIGATLYILVFPHQDPKDYSFPYNMLHPIEVTGFFTYVVCLLYESIPMLSLFNCFSLPTEQLLGTLIMNTTSMFCLLWRDLSRDCSNKNLTVNNTDTKQVINRIKRSDMNDIIRRHQKLFKIVDKINFVFGENVFLTMLFFSLNICFSAYYIIAGDTLDAMKSLIVAVMQSTSVYLMHCLPGQLLNDASFKVSEAAYNYLWYKSDTDIQICIKMIILRANKPIYITGRGFYKLSNVCYTSIMSGALSYFSLLWQVYKDSD